MAFSAADLQKRHNLEGAPDPFPSLAESPTRTRASQSGQAELDPSSQAAFPSLAPSPTPGSGPAPNSAWSAAGPRIKPAQAKTPLFTDNFTLGQIDLSTAGKDGKQASLGEVLKQVMNKYKVKIDASGNAKTKQTTFFIKAETQKDLDKAKRSLLALLSPVVTLVINAPVSTIASIIGPKGSTLKHIRDQTSVRVDIPKKDTAEGHPNGNGVANGQVSMSEDDEPTVPVTLVGPSPLAYEAQNMLNGIIASKTSKSVQRVKDIPGHVLPFIIARRPYFISAAQGSDIHLALNAADREITVSGDRETVTRVTETIKSTVETVKGNITSLKISLPKRQHRLLVGKAIDEIMVKSKCTCMIAPAEDPSEEVVVWGNPPDLPSGLTAVMERANSAYIHEFPLPGPVSLSRQLLNYFTHVNYSETLASAHPGVSVYTPGPKLVERGGILNLDIIGGDKSKVDGVVRQVSEIIGKLIGATKDVNIDWLIHKVILGKNGKKIKQFHDAHNVQVFFPSESSESSTILLVYDPLSPKASPIPDEKSKHLEEVAKELLTFAKDASDVRSVTVPVEKRWHEAVVGSNNTTLNAIIGEDKALSIKVGKEAGDSSQEDIILIRGSASDVDRAVKQIQDIVENAKKDEIVNSYELEFDIDREFVGRIVGAQGAGVNKLRDQLGVKVDVSDEVDEKENSGAKKKKGGHTHQKSKVKITGRKENVQEAKKRILAQLERLADETSEVLKIPAQYHASLIGQSGKYAIRLEEKYAVKITFPRHSVPEGDAKATREIIKSDEVLIKGGKKGVASCKAELLEAVEFEKEMNNSVTFFVPNRAVSRILGKGGATINEIKDNTSTQVDVDKSSEDTGTTKITVRGSKKGINTAKTDILSISDQIAEEATAVVNVESRFHRTIIGAGGQGLKEIIASCGGPEDSRTQAGLVRFPRQGEPSDEVRLRGEPKLVEKLKVQLEKTAKELRDRIVLAVEIPNAQHRALIGRGGQNLTEIQNRLKVQVQFPGSRAYTITGEPENSADVAGVDPQNIVKVSGPKVACQTAVGELKSKVKAPQAELVSDTVSVPLKYHHFVSQQGAFFRRLRSYGVHVEQSAQPSKSAVPAKKSDSSNMARIDDEETGVTDIQWEVTANYTEAEEGESTWTLKARDQEGLDKAKDAVSSAVEHAERMSHVGYLTLSDRSSFPRIVGSKGSNVSRLRAETGAEITVGKDDSTIVIIGTEHDILEAKAAILKMVSTPARSGRRT